MEKTLGELAAILGGEVVGDKNIKISGVMGIAEAKEGDITFISNPKYIKYFETTKASAVIVSKDFQGSSKPMIKVEEPYLAFAKVLSFMTASERVYFGVSEDAWVDPEAKVADEVAVYPLVYIGKGAVLKSRAVLYPGVFLGDGAEVGEESVLYPNVTVMNRCIVGNRVTIHSGTVIGSDGFGFAQDGTKHVKIPQVGIVKIEDDVEIGSNCSIDRAAMGVTLIRRGVIMDNLVQIGHNVEVGEDSIVIAQVGISGSTHIGKNVILAGQAGLVGHIKIGDGVFVTPKTGVSNDIAEGVVSGYPHMEHRKWLKVMSLVSKLPEMRKELKRLEKKIEELEKGKK